MWSAGKVVGIVCLVWIMGLILVGCSIFKNTKKDAHISDVRESSKLDYAFVDTSKSVELVTESLDVKIPKRSYGIDVPFLNGEVNFLNGLYKLTLKLDDATGRLKGDFTLPDTTLQGKKTTLRIDQNGKSESRKEESKKQVKDKKVIEESTVSWKTIVGAIVGLIVVILVLWLWLKPKKII